MAQGGQPEGRGRVVEARWDEIHGIMERAVKRGLERRQAEPVTQLGVDEKAFRKGHHYLTLVNDPRGRVLYVALDGFWATLTPEQIGAVEAVAMDMWNPYIASVREHLPGADGKIVFDKFHIAQLGGAVDKVPARRTRSCARTETTRWWERAMTGCGIRHGWSPKTGERLRPCGTAA